LIKFKEKIEFIMQTKAGIMLSIPVSLIFNQKSGLVDYAYKHYAYKKKNI